MNKPTDSDDDIAPTIALMASACQSLMSQEEWITAARKGQLITTHLTDHVSTTAHALVPYQSSHLVLYYPRDREWSLDEHFQVSHRHTRTGYYLIPGMDHGKLTLQGAIFGTQALNTLPQAIENWHASIQERRQKAEAKHERLKRETREAERLLREMCQRLQEVCSEILKQSKSD